MTYEATRGYYTSRLLTACNLLASNMIVTHSKVRNRLLQNAVAILWVKVLILLMVASYKEKEVRDGNTCFKCSPLIRDAANKENLWEALLYKHISTVSKDVAPWGIMPTKQARDDDADH
ncbi:unnamed protein product [Triticum turgidum subsp. durum]|uniref:Uncharacterized protein n=1 Tax=Triticum turgidum subsp. durum TaxID=4567 RepID=A0A9R1AIZ5_TRITD|nr:unnamed protein product [Triticum turgidum subsp. durum]